MIIKRGLESIGKYGSVVTGSSLQLNFRRACWMFIVVQAAQRDPCLNQSVELFEKEKHMEAFATISAQDGTG